MVYVLNINSSPLMPCTEAKAKKLLRNHKAQIVKYEPFTIQLLFECENKIQDVVLGVDAGSKHIGLSATTATKELYAADIELRNDIVDLLSTRKELRVSRRRRLRYRKVRFNNRTHSKHKGWLPPSVRHKIDCHLKVVEEVYGILPISRIIVETASFDIQKIKNPNIQRKEYQEGEQSGFWNVREYVLFRDNHTCQHCHGKSKDDVLNVHHIESRKIGGDAPNNLITLCRTCHEAYHRGNIELNFKRGKSYKDATFMGIMRWAFYEKLKALYLNVSMTYGYITKSIRIQYNLPKEHYIDARCISGNPQAQPLGYYYYQKKVRCHNRQIYKMKILKGNKRKRNQADYTVKGFRLFDKVKYKGIKCFIFARRVSGYFDIRQLDGTKISANANYKKLQLLQMRTGYLTEQRTQIG